MDNNNINTNNVLNSDTFKPIDTTLLNDPNSNINQQFIIASINQLQENDKLVLQNLTYKVIREKTREFSKINGDENRQDCMFLKIIQMNKVTESLIKNFKKNDEQYKKSTETAVTMVVDRNEIIIKVIISRKISFKMFGRTFSQMNWQNYF